MGNSLHPRLNAETGGFLDAVKDLKLIAKVGCVAGAAWHMD